MYCGVILLVEHGCEKYVPGVGLGGGKVKWTTGIYNFMSVAVASTW